MQATPSKSQPCDPVAVSLTVTNTGAVPGAEVAQLYLTLQEPSVQTPQRALVGFQRVWLEPGEAPWMHIAPPPPTCIDKHPSPMTRHGCLNLGNFALCGQPVSCVCCVGASATVSFVVTPRLQSVMRVSGPMCAQRWLPPLP